MKLCVLWAASIWAKNCAVDNFEWDFTCYYTSFLLRSAAGSAFFYPFSRLAVTMEDVCGLPDLGSCPQGVHRITPTEV